MHYRTYILLVLCSGSLWCGVSCGSSDSSSAQAKASGERDERFAGRAGEPGVLVLASGDSGAMGLATATATDSSGRSDLEPSKAGQRAKSVTRHGITWHFDREVPVGQFVNGDWWVVGPVEIVRTDPEWDGQHHGSVVNPRYAPAQGLDGRFAYDPSLRVSFPKKIEPTSSVVTVMSWKTGEPGAPEVPPKQSLQVPRPAIRRAAVLTVVSAPPPDDAFRPTYAGKRKRLHRVRDLDMSILPDLEPIAGAPAIREILGRFEHVWLDLIHAWQGRYLHPQENMPDYGRDIALSFNEASLLLLLDIDPDEKKTLATRLAQIGIDLYGVLSTDAEWGVIGGGIGSGRKWPILLAGLLLDDAEMIGIGKTASDRAFMEDCQTFYLTENDLPNYPGRKVGEAVWGERHCDFGRNRYKDPGNTGYQWCCTANSWVGAVLAAHILGAKELWGHDALFDYQDWYMEHMKAERWKRSMSEFAGRMWDRYRLQAGSLSAKEPAKTGASEKPDSKGK